MFKGRRSPSEYVSLCPVEGLTIRVRLDESGSFRIERFDLRSKPSLQFDLARYPAWPVTTVEGNARALCRTLIMIIFDPAVCRNVDGKADYIEQFSSDEHIDFFLQNRVNRAKCKQLRLCFDVKGDVTRAVLEGEKEMINKGALGMLYKLSEFCSEGKDYIVCRPVPWPDLPGEVWPHVVQHLTKAERRMTAQSCKTLWRTVKAAVNTSVPEQETNLMTMVMLCVPMTRKAPVCCYLKRSRSLIRPPLYLLYSNLDQLWLAAKYTGSTYLLSTSQDDFSQTSQSFVGSVQKNFLGTKYTLSQREIVFRLGESWVREHELAEVQYETNLLGMKGPPRKMRVQLPGLVTCAQGKRECPRRLEGDGVLKDASALRLVTATPTWRGAERRLLPEREVLPSVKSFLLVDEASPDRIVLQFAKTSADTFVLYFSHPLCPLQAFAICLTTFDFKLACE